MWFIEMVNARIRWPNDTLFTLLKFRIPDFFLYVVLSVLLFVTVGLFHEYRRQKDETEFKPSAPASIIAFNLIGRPKQISPGSATEERLKRFAGIIEALGPLLTFIATITVAIIGAVAKSAAQVK